MHKSTLFLGLVALPLIVTGCAHNAPAPPSTQPATPTVSKSELDADTIKWAACEMVNIAKYDDGVSDAATIVGMTEASCSREALYMRFASQAYYNGFLRDTDFTNLLRNEAITLVLRHRAEKKNRRTANAK